MDFIFIIIECIDEIVDMQGLKLQVVEIIEVVMCGEIEFNESLICCVVLFKGLDVGVLQCVYDECL